MEKPIPRNQSPENITLNPSQKQNVAVVQSKEESLLDFSSMFKNNGFSKRPMPKLGANRKVQSQGPNWLLQIPAKLNISISDLEERRYLNQERWKMMVKTDIQQQSPNAALISCLKYLTKSNSSSTSPLPQFKSIKYKAIDPLLTRRQTILTSCQSIRQEQQMKWLNTKVHQIQQEGKNVQFLNQVTQNMKNKQKAFIYVCYGQVLCPIGFEITPLVPLDAYKTLGEINPQKLQMWIILASPLRQHAPFVIKRWTDIEKEMSSRWPEYLDLEQTKKGRQTWEDQINQVSPTTKQVSCWIELSYSQN